MLKALLKVLIFAIGFAKVRMILCLGTGLSGGLGWGLWFGRSCWVLGLARLIGLEWRGRWRLRGCGGGERSGSLLGWWFLMVGRLNMAKLEWLPAVECCLPVC